MCARQIKVFQFSLPLFGEGVVRLPSTARIGRAQFHRARCASKEGTWPLPPTLTSESPPPVQCLSPSYPLGFLTVSGRFAEEEKGRGYFSSEVLGRPRCRSVDSSPNVVAITACQSAVRSCNHTFLVAADSWTYIKPRDPCSDLDQAGIKASLTRRTLIVPACFSAWARS
jgi:hypothetical protein